MHNYNSTVGLHSLRDHPLETLPFGKTTLLTPQSSEETIQIPCEVTIFWIDLLVRPLVRDHPLNRPTSGHDHLSQTTQLLSEEIILWTDHSLEGPPLDVNIFWNNQPPDTISSWRPPSYPLKRPPSGY